jgi:hypothetical protein
LVEEAFGGTRSSRRIKTIAMYEHEGDCTLRQQPNFAGELARGGDTGLGQPIGQMRLEHRLVGVRFVRRAAPAIWSMLTRL